jgi:aspartate aminotransferase
MFEAIQKLPPDPILGLTGAFEADPNPRKIDLGAGVYKDESGITPIFEAVKRAEKLWHEQEQTKVYIPQPGYADFNTALLRHVFGAAHPAVAAGRIRSVMAPGGCGGLRLGAELVNRSRPGATIWLSAPTWNNHVPLLGGAGLRIREYPYYDPDRHVVDFAAMMQTLSGVEQSDVVLLHACCHNPTGADLTVAQWDEVAEVARRQGFLPFVDLAYQGLGNGLDEDAYGPRRLAGTVPELLLAYSCSKNFGLYRDRIGMVATLAKDAASAEAAETHVTSIARGIYSMSPSHGGAIVKTILGDKALYGVWKKELDAMRTRINGLRALLSDTLAKKKSPRDFSFIKNQRGLFSLLGLSKEQMQRLRSEFSIYAVESSRINIAGISPKNVDYLAESIIAVLR